MQTLGERAEIALRMVREVPVLSYDTEGSGLDWKRNHSTGYVLADGTTSIYIPVRHGGGGNLLDPNCLPLETPEGPYVKHSFEVELAKAFAQRRIDKKKTVGHNLLFDMHFSANSDIILGRECEDTQHNMAMLDEFARSYSLDSCAKYYKVTAKLGDELYQHLANLFGGVADRKQMGNYWRLAGNDRIGVEYAEGDGITTFELWREQQPHLDEEELRTIHTVESQLIYTVFKMERQGVKVNEERLHQVKQELRRKLEDARRMLPSNFNERSPIDVRKVIEDAGYDDWPTTAPSTRFPNGQPSFTEKYLKTKPEGKAIVAVRKFSNLSNSFITPLEERHLFKGRIHCQFNQLRADEYGTISGRFSSSQPNMQQIPKRDKDLGALFRSIFVPDDGMEFIEADYSQCEPRLFAHYSQEPALVNGYNSVPPLDMHHVVAMELNVERDPTAKRMNMGLLTGMQSRTFASHMNWSLDYAAEMFNRWSDSFPGIAKFQRQAKQAFRQRGFVKTILGRRCHLESAQYAYRAVSRIIQGGNADIIKYKMLQCDKYVESEGLEELIQFLLTVHDSLGWQALLGERGRKITWELVRMCCDVQTAPFNLRVPFIMDVGIGADWSEATYGDKNKEFD